MRNQLVLIAVVACAATQATHSGRDPDVVRARAFQLVDDAGRIRASLTVLPPKDGEDETVLLRMIDAHGRPDVKIGVSDRGAAMAVCGPSDPGCVQLLGEGQVKLTDRGGRTLDVKP